jgi:hypothetical protein
MYFLGKHFHIIQIFYKIFMGKEPNPYLANLKSWMRILTKIIRIRAIGSNPLWEMKTIKVHLLSSKFWCAHLTA